MHDPAYRRQAVRAGRQKGCLIYIPAQTLEAAGVDPAGPPPRYRLWAGKGGSVLIRLYREA